MKKLKVFIFLCGICICFSANAVVFSIITTLIEELRSQTSAWFIAVKQMALSASQVSSVTNTSAKTFAQSLNSISQNKRTLKAYVDYSAKFGQPLSTQCIEMDKTKQILKKFDTSKQITSMITGYEFTTTNQAKEGQFVDSKLNAHSEYCNQEEQKTNMCKKSSKPSADTNIANILSKDELDEDSIKDAYNYNHNINQFKIDDKNNCKNTDCRKNAYNQLQQNAFLSMSTYTINNQINQRAKNTNIQN